MDDVLGGEYQCHFVAPIWGRRVNPRPARKRIRSDLLLPDRRLVSPVGRRVTTIGYQIWQSIWSTVGSR